MTTIEVAPRPAVPEPPAPPPRRRRHRTSAFLLLPLLAVCGLVHGIGMSASPAAFDDEGTYVAQAWAVLRHGELAHYTYWYDHPPLGWIQMAGWFGLTGALDRLPYSIDAGREFMLVVHLVSAVLIFVLARRLGLRRGTAALAVALFSLTPLSVHFQRMVFLDNIAMLWVLAALTLAASPRRSAAAAAGSGLCVTVAVLSKETAAVLVPAVIWLLWRNSDPRTRRFNIVVFGTLVVLTMAFYPLYALVKNELLPGDGHVSLLWAIQWQLFSRADSGTVLDAGSGSHGLLMSWLREDPYLLIAGVALTPVALAVRRLRPIGLALGIQVVMMLRGGYLPVPYVIGLLPFAALIIAGVTDSLWSLRPGPAAVRRLPGGIAVAALAALLVVAGGRWFAAAREQVTDRDVHLGQAVEWLAREVPDGRRVVVDDTLWVDLAERGFDPAELEVIWSFKVDLDPAVTSRLPNGWRDLDYLVLKDIGDLSTLPIQAEALRHSHEAARFGDGPDTLTIRKVDNGR